MSEPDVTFHVVLSDVKGIGVFLVQVGVGALLWEGAAGESMQQM